MIVLFWLLNFAISWLNAWVCGRSWNESKHVGGAPHFMNWMGAIMSACGFTWCYLVIAVSVGGGYPVKQDDGTMAPLLTPEMIQATADLGYVLIIAPVLGSGIAITVQAWAIAWKRRTLGSGAVAAYDTFAMAYNIGQAVEHVPSALGRLGSFFGSKDDKKGQGLVVALVVAVVLAGVLTTYTIVTSVAARARMRAQFDALSTDRGAA